MSDAAIKDVAMWVFAVPLIVLGAWALLFNVLRYTPLLRGRDRLARDRLPSSVPLVGSLFVSFGLYVAPIPWHPAFLVVIIFELFSIDFSFEAVEDPPTTGEMCDRERSDEPQATDGRQDG